MLHSHQQYLSVPVDPNPKKMYITISLLKILPIFTDLEMGEQIFKSCPIVHVFTLTDMDAHT